MPIHGQRVPLESQFTSSRHRQNLHSGRRILQSDRMRNGTYRGHMHMRVSGPIPGTNSGSESSPNVELDLVRVSRPILYWNTGTSVHRARADMYAAYDVSEGQLA